MHLLNLIIKYRFYIISLVLGLIVGFVVYFLIGHGSKTENFDVPIYSLVDNIFGDDLIPSIDNSEKPMSFYTGNDPTHGSVNYGIHPELFSKPQQSDGKTRVKISAGDPPTEGKDRNMIRIVSKKKYNSGLFVISANHIPEGPGVWPSFWLTSPDNWACDGEIDIIEGANSIDLNSSRNQSTLHTSDRLDAPPCRQNPQNVKGVTNGGMCNQPNGNRGNEFMTCGCGAKALCPYLGCGVELDSTNSFGYGFNINNGGIYAAELTPQGAITIWFFPQNEKIPDDLLSENPNPEIWPSTNRIKFDACPGQFANLQLIVNTTLCGDWGGGAYKDPKTGKTGLVNCQTDIRTADLSKAFWSIEYIKVFKRSDATDIPYRPPYTPPDSTPTNCYPLGADPYGDDPKCEKTQCCGDLKLCFNPGPNNYTCQNGPCASSIPLPSCSKVLPCKNPLCM